MLRYPSWSDDERLLPSVISLFGDENRGTCYAFSPDQPWVAPLETLGPELLDAVSAFVGVAFDTVAVQLYRDGTGSEPHTDPFDCQAILSLGATRTFGYRDEEVQVADGDLVVIGREQHCVPRQDVPGTRCSLVFRRSRE